MKRMRRRLASARAYYRLAAKAFKNGEYAQSESYRKMAYRLVDQDRREQAALADRIKYEKEWRAKMAARQKEATS